MEYRIKYIPKSDDYIFSIWIEASSKKDAINRLKKLTKVYKIISVEEERN